MRVPVSVCFHLLQPHFLMKWVKMYVRVDLLQNPAGRSRKGSDEFKNEKNRVYMTGKSACKTDLTKWKNRVEVTRGAQENDQLNTKHKRHGFFSDSRLLGLLIKDGERLGEANIAALTSQMDLTPGTWLRISILKNIFLACTLGFTKELLPHHSSVPS